MKKLLLFFFRRFLSSSVRKKFLKRSFSVRTKELNESVGFEKLLQDLTSSVLQSERKDWRNEATFRHCIQKAASLLQVQTEMLLQENSLAVYTLFWWRGNFKTEASHFVPSA